jgi:hypothetical protein
MDKSNQTQTTDNDFTKQYATDELYKKVALELSSRNKKTKGGRKLKLTPEMLRQFLFYVSMGESLKNAAESVYMGEKTRQDYNTRSETFSGVSSLAKNNISMRSRIAVAKAIIGRKPCYYKLLHPATKQPAYIELREVPPDVKVAMWWLEKVEKIGNQEKSESIPSLGAPQNEKEALLLESLLNRHADYVESGLNK